MWDLIVSVPDLCLYFYFRPLARLVDGDADLGSVFIGFDFKF